MDALGEKQIKQSSEGDFWVFKQMIQSTEVSNDLGSIEQAIWTIEVEYELANFE